MDSSVSEPPGEPTRGTLLVVDDDPAFRETLVELCAGGGYEVASAATAAEALDRARSRPPSAILLDVLLPDQDGFAVLGALRADERTASTPVILMTGSPSEQVIARAVEGGANDFLRKPFDPQELYARLAMVTQGRTPPTALRVIRLERALRDSEKRLGVIFERSPDPIFIVTTGWRVVDANPAAERVFDRRREVLWEESLLSLSPSFQPRGESTAAVLDMLSRSGQPGEWCARRSDGGLLHLEVIVQPIPLAGIDDARLVWARDVTRQRSLEEALQQAQKLEALGLLAGGVAHDFNNLLTVILGFLELALSHSGAEPIMGERRVQLQEVRKAAERASDLTRQLLALGRKKALSPARTISPDTVVARCAPLLQRIIREDVRLDIRLGAPDACILADPSRLEQVLMNLTANARDAMPHGGSLVIETTDVMVGSEGAVGVELVPGRYVVLRIADTGIGMTDSVKVRIFEPFFTTKGPDKGTGLGLSVVFAIVHEHGGKIHVESVPGEGTSFTIYFPTTERQAVEAPTPGGLRRGHETILVVEDDALVRDVEVAMLETLGYTPIACSSAAEAVSVFQARRSKIALVLSDVVMPDENGVELERRLRAIEPGLRIILVSGYPRDLEVEGVAWLQKPITIHELSVRVREALDRKA